MISLFYCWISAHTDNIFIIIHIINTATKEIQLYKLSI